MIPGSLGKKKQNKMKLKIKGRGLEKAEFFWWGGVEVVRSGSSSHNATTTEVKEPQGGVENTSGVHRWRYSSYSGQRTKCKLH